jgi:hypothetical protein
MAVLININTSVEDVMEWEQEITDEHQEYIERIIRTFEMKLENYLTNVIRGYQQVNIETSYNPITNKFKLVNCNKPFQHHINDAFITELKEYV